MTTSICRGFVAYFAVGALMLTGCSQPLAQSEAVSQPSTEAQSPAYTSEPMPKYDVPEYTTDLDLTAEEALIGLQRYIFVSEQVMKSGGEDTLHIDSVSVGSAKEGLDKTASNFRKGKKKFLGHIVSQDFHIHEVDIAKENRNELSISACLPEKTWGIRKANEEESKDDYEEPFQMIWTLESHGSTWKFFAGALRKVLLILDPYPLTTA